MWIVCFVVFSMEWFLEYTIQKMEFPMMAFRAVATAVEEEEEVDLA